MPRIVELPVPIPSTCEEWDQLFQSRPLQPAEQDELLKWLDMLNLVPRIQEQLYELKNKLIKTQAELAGTRTELAGTQAEQAKTQAELAETQAEQAKSQAEQAKTQAEQAKTQAEQAKILEQLLTDLFGIKPRDIDNLFKLNYWKVKDWRLFWVKGETKSVKKQQQHNVYNSLAHNFSAADAHKRLRQLWAEPNARKQICDHIAGLPRDTPEDQFLELTTSVSPKLLLHMSSLEQPYALQLSRIFILVSFALRQNYNKIRTPLSALKAKDGFEWKGNEDVREQSEYDYVCLSIQEDETLDQNYRRIRDNLCQEGDQNVSEKSNKDNQELEMSQITSEEKYNQLLSVFKRFADKYISRLPNLLVTFRYIDPPKPTASGTTLDKMPMTKQFHTMHPHMSAGVLKASPEQHLHTPKLPSAIPHRPRLVRPLVVATPSNIFTQTAFRGFRFLCKRG